MTILVVVIIVLISAVRSDPFDECRKTAKFSTKTGYDMLTKITASVTRPTGYTPVQVNMVFRHGERFPGDDDVEEMKEFAKKINKYNGTISPNVSLALPWQPFFSGKEDKMLAKEGETVLYNLGKRIRSRFPEVFQKIYTTYTYKFMSTCKTRTTGSSDSLAMGIYEGHGHLGSDKLQPVHLKVNPCDKDIILKAQDNCAKYEKEVGNNDTAKQEAKNFEKGPEINAVLKSIKKKFGDVNMTLSFDEIKMMYEVCSWEIIMRNGSINNGMCSMFTQDELSVIEYHEDMDDYYKRSTGYKISYETSCPLLKDIYQSLQAKAKPSVSDAGYSAVFRAGHSDTMLPFFALLGIYTNNLTMTSKNYQSNKNRIFRGGCLAPFSSNLYFVLYKNNTNSQQHKIQLYVNERLTKIPGCLSATDCDFADFESQYKNIVDNCNYEEMCKVSSKQPSSNANKLDTIYMVNVMVLIYMVLSII